MLALLSNKGSSSSPEWTVASAGFSPNEQLVDVLTCSSVTADSNGGITVQGSGGMPQVSGNLLHTQLWFVLMLLVQVLMPISALSKSGTVCPKVATGQASSASTLKTMLPTALALAILVAKIFS